MQDLFQTVPLLEKEAHLAFPLIQMSNPGMTLRDWLAFVRRRVRRNSAQAGLVAVKDRRGILHALYSYTTERTLRFESCVRIGDMIVGRLPGAALDEAILFGIQELAQRLGCDALLIDVPVPAGNASAIARQIGLVGFGTGPSPVIILSASPEAVCR